MCEYATKLIAWMDGELAEGEATAVATHVERCAECRECLAAYKQASAGFEMYCDAMADVAEEARVAEERREIPRRYANDLRSFATLTRDDNVKPKQQITGREKRAPSLRDASLRTPTLVGSSARDDNVKPKQQITGREKRAPSLRDASLRTPTLVGSSARDDTVKQKRVRVAIAAGAIAGAAAIAMLLMLPRQRVAQESAHAVPRPAEPAEVAEEVQVPARQSEAPAAAGTPHAVQRELPDAHVAQRTAPLAVSTSTEHRHAAVRPARLENANRETGRPARPEDATGVGPTQTAQNGQMRNASAALRPQGESRPQAENVNADEPPIEIAVPTDGMFPPGAVPEGIGFTAVVTITAGDSAQLAALRRR